MHRTTQNVTTENIFNRKGDIYKTGNDKFTHINGTLNINILF